MRELQEMLQEYRCSCNAVKQRILELNDRISGRESLRTDETVKALEQRRYLLYCELAEMAEAIRSLEEYLAPEWDEAVNF